MEKIANKFTKSEFWKYMLIFLSCFIPRVIVNLFVVTTPGGHDDLGTLIAPAILAGYDWGGLLQDTAYYGFGYSVIYTPILMIFKNNSYLMFQLIFALNAVMQALIGIIIYTLLKKYYKICSELENIYISVIMSYLTFTGACKIANDVVLPLLTFIFIWIITLLFESNNRRDTNKLTLILLILMAYSLTLHTRSIIYWIGIAVTIFFYRAFRKKWIVNTKIFMTGSVLLYGIISISIKTFQNAIWYSTETLTNSTGAIGKMLNLGIKSFFEQDSFIIFITLICSNFFAIIQYSCGLFLIGILGIIYYIKAYWEKEYIILKEVEGVGLVFSISCFVMMFGGLCISYLYPALDAYERNVSYSGFFYIRYYYNFGLPIILFGILVCMVITRSNTYKLFIIRAIFIFTLCYAVIVEILSKVPLRDYWTSFGMKFGGNDQSILDTYSYKMIFYGTLFVIILFLFLLKKNRNIALIFLLLISIYNYSYQNLNSAKNWAQNYLHKSDSFEKIIENFNLNTEEYYICVENKSAAYGLQLRKMDCTIYKDLDKYENEIIIYLRNNKSDQLIENNYKELRISNDEYLYIKDLKTYRMIKEGVDI